MTSGFLIKRNGTAFSLPYKALHFVTVQFFIEAEKCRIDIQFSPPKTDSKNVFCNVKNSPSYCRASFAFMYFCEITLFCIFEGLWGTHTNERTHSWELKQSKAREKLHIPQKSDCVYVRGLGWRWAKTAEKFSFYQIRTFLSLFDLHNAMAASRKGLKNVECRFFPCRMRREWERGWAGMSVCVYACLFIYLTIDSPSSPGCTMMHL